MNYREKYVHHCDPYDETISRDRRLTLFEDKSGLREIPMDQASHILDLVPKEDQDHVSSWTDGKTLFVMTEPYRSSLAPAPGLSRIKIPIDISPYCGAWNPDKGAAPGTTSWLYVESKYAQLLFRIADALNCAAHESPPWNWVEADDA
jgi:hypothetical protein